MGIDNNEVDKNLNIIAKSSLIVLFSILISKVLTYVYRILIARYFGPETYGLFSIAIVISGFFIAFSAMGLSDGLLRYISLYRGKGEKDNARWVFEISLYVMIITGFLASILLFFISSTISFLILGNSSLTIYLKIFSLVVFLTVLSYPFLAALRAFEEISSYSLAFNVSQSIGKVGSLIILIFIGLKSQNSVAFSYVFGTVILFVLSFILCRLKIPDIFIKGEVKNNDKNKISKDLFKYSIPLLFFGIIGTLFYWVDTLSIGYLKDAIGVGFYSAAVPIAFLLVSSSEIFMQIFLPLITKEFSKKNLQLVKELSKQVGKWIFAINMPIFMIITFSSSQVIGILFGKEYLVASTALQILSVGVLFISMASVSQQLLAMKGESKTILFSMVLASIVNLILNFVLIPMENIAFIQNETGINGAAIATTLSLIFFGLLFYVQAYRMLNIIPLRRKMINIALSALISLIPIYYLRPYLSGVKELYLIYEIFIYSIFYALLIIFTKALDFNDFQVIKKITHKLFKREN